MYCFSFAFTFCFYFLIVKDVHRKKQKLNTNTNKKSLNIYTAEETLQLAGIERSIRAFICLPVGTTSDLFSEIRIDILSIYNTVLYGLFAVKLI